MKPQTYLIGGAPRVGKTTAIQQLIKTQPMLAGSTDAVRHALRTMTAQDQYPDLFKSNQLGFDSPGNIDLFVNHPDISVKMQNAESEVVWNACVGYIQSNIEDGVSVALEGVAILPKNVVSYSADARVVFLVCPDDQTEQILEHAKNNPYDWLHKYSDDVIRAFATFNYHMNQYFYKEAQKYALPYILVRQEFFSDDIDTAVRQLLR